MAGRRPATRLGRVLGSHFRRAREALGLTQAEAARRSGLRLRSLQEWEQGTRIPRWDRVIQLARGLGVSLDVLAGLAEPPRRER